MKEFFKKNASIVAALGANIGVTLAKFIGFLLTRSTAMLNESIHSLIDCVNEITLLYGKNTASSESSDNYNFGTSRQQYFWSILDKDRINGWNSYGETIKPTYVEYNHRTNEILGLHNIVPADLPTLIKIYSLQN